MIGWVAAILLSASISKDFREYRFSDTIIPVSQPANGKMIVVASQPELEYTGGFGWINDGSQGWDLSSDTLRLSTVKFPEPQKSPDSLYHVIIRKYSYGRNIEEARSRAERIQYNASSRDSVLDLASGYAIDKDSKFRLQQIEIEIQIPVGKKIRFDESITEKLNPVNFKIRKTYRRRRVVNIEINDDYSFGFRTGVDYTMGIDGRLKDPAGNAVSNDDYRYKNDENTKPTIEEQRKKVEEEQRKLKQMEDEKNKSKQKSTTDSAESMDDKENDAAVGSPSPVFSLVNWFS